MRRVTTLALAALLVLPSCAAVEAVAGWIAPSGDDPHVASVFSNDPVDVGLGALQWILGGTGAVGLAAAVKMARAFRQERQKPSRAAGDVEHLRREFAAHHARLDDTIARVAAVESVLMTRGLAVEPRDGA